MSVSVRRHPLSCIFDFDSLQGKPKNNARTHGNSTRSSQFRHVRHENFGTKFRDDFDTSKSSHFVPNFRDELSRQSYHGPLFRMLDWIQVRGVRRSPLWAPRSWTRAPGVLARLRRAARGGTGPRAWGPQWTPMDPHCLPASTSNIHWATIPTRNFQLTVKDVKRNAKFTMDVTMGVPVSILTSLKVEHNR